jgi:preprotein translocase subunit SecG
MINIILTVSAIVGIILVLIILFQKTEGGSLDLGTQSSIGSPGASAPKKGNNMVKITYIIAFGFLFWCLASAALMNRNFGPNINLEEISNEIEVDDNLTDKIPEVPLK